MQVYNYINYIMQGDIFLEYTCKISNTSEINFKSKIFHGKLRELPSSDICQIKLKEYILHVQEYNIRII